MYKMFQVKMAGGHNDPDDLIVRAFKDYEVNKAEVDDVFNEFEVDDDGYIESKVVIGLFVAGGGEEKKEEERKEKTPTPEPEEAPPDDGGKKKKKKKKAAK